MHVCLSHITYKKNLNTEAKADLKEFKVHVQSAAARILAVVVGHTAPEPALHLVLRIVALLGV